MTRIDLTYKAIVKKMLPELMKALPDDIIFYVIQPYLSLEDMRKAIIYNKYYNQAINLKKVFTPNQIIMHFQCQLPKQMNIFTIDEESFQYLKKIIVCMKTVSAIHRMRERRLQCSELYY